jgi:hypothetical protein
VKNQMKYPAPPPTRAEAFPGGDEIGGGGGKRFDSHEFGRRDRDVGDF